MDEAIAAWASRHPRIRRIWSFDGRLALEPEPAADSEETFAVWMAHAERWGADLRQRVDPHLELAWYDPDSAPSAKELLYEKGMR